jgi:hypothetical protein
MGQRSYEEYKRSITAILDHKQASARAGRSYTCNMRVDLNVFVSGLEEHNTAHDVITSSSGYLMEGYLVALAVFIENNPERMLSAITALSTRDLQSPLADRVLRPVYTAFRREFYTRHPERRPVIKAYHEQLNADGTTTLVERVTQLTAAEQAD